MSYSHNFIFCRKDILSEDYIPSELPSREPHVKELQSCIFPALRKNKPLHAWLHGPAGSGKTTTVKYVLEKLEKQSSIKGIYINCWKRNTFYAVLDKLLTELRVLLAEERSISYKLERLERHIQKEPLLIVLDEIDQIPLKERNALLYNLSTLGNVGLICITGSLYPLVTLHEKIQSRLNTRRIEFKSYNSIGLVSMLKDRAEYALVPGSWDRKILVRIAELSEGDARIAIQTLRASALLARDSFCNSIKHDHIVKAFNTVKDLQKIYRLKTYTEHHQLLYQIIKEKGEILSRDLREEYEKRCTEKKYEPMAQRTTDGYLNSDLIRAKLIKRRRAKMRGKLFIYSVVD